MLGSYNYIKGNDEKALIYYLEVLEEYKKNINVERIMNTLSNISCIYNIIGEYDSSLKISSSAIEYAYSTKKELYITYITQHYLLSNFMLDRVEKIHEFLSILLNENRLNIVSAIICILSLYESENEKAKRLIEMYSYDSNVQIISKYLETKNLDLLNKLVEKPYFKKIVEKLKTNHKRYR